MKTTQSFVRYALAVAFVLGTIANGCATHSGRHDDTVYVGRPHGGGPVHGAVHGVHCIEHAATLRGCD